MMKASVRSQPIRAFATSATPTPYVHVPLLSFAPSTSTDKLVVPLPTPLFSTPSRPSLLHRLVISHLASLRQGNQATKDRSQVNYSGKKIRPQKGTGKARLGSRGSPMLKGGGHAFGLTPKGPDGWKRKVNRKEENLGLRVGLSDKWRAGQLVVVDRLALPRVSTRDLNLRLGERGWLDALFIQSTSDALGPEATDAALFEKEAFYLSAGNLPSVSVLEDASDLGIWEILRRKKVVIELQAVDEVVRRLDPEGKLTLGEEELYEESESEAEIEGLEEQLEAAMSELKLEGSRA